MKEKTMGIILTSALGAACAFMGALQGNLVGYLTAQEKLEPKRIKFVQDLNNDGIDDAIIYIKNGHQTPMYGTNNHYISGEAMQKRTKEPESKYQQIEERLNNGS